MITFLGPTCFEVINKPAAFPNCRNAGSSDLETIEVERRGRLSRVTRGKLMPRRHAYQRARLPMPPLPNATLLTARQIAAERMERARVAVTGEVFGQPKIRSTPTDSPCDGRKLFWDTTAYRATVVTFAKYSWQAPWPPCFRQGATSAPLPRMPIMV